MRKLLKDHWIFLTILVLGIFLRSYGASQLFMYSHDQDLAGWFIRDVLENGHLRLIGQETSSKGVFIGPLYFYLLIPFYLAFGMDPLGGVILSILVGAFSIFSFYFIFGRIFSRRVGQMASLIYAVGFLTVMTDREVVPTIFAMLWSVWFLYCLNLFLKGNKRGYLLFGLLVGLVWNVNLALLIVSPLVIPALVFAKKKVNWKSLTAGLVILLAVSLPFVIFETKHGFSQTKSVYLSLTTAKDFTTGSGSGLAKLDRVMQLVKRNCLRLLWGDGVRINDSYALFVFVGIYVYLVVKKKISVPQAVILFFWQILYVIFFTKNPINVSEYYLNGMNVVWILVLAVFLTELLRGERTKLLGILFLISFVGINLSRFFNQPVNHSGYLERKALVAWVKADAGAHGYPCVAVSYITKPGFDFGYRYLFYLAKMHVNKPDSGSPTYTIVFPISMVGRVDTTFGAIGLVKPDYERYTREVVERSCAGENSNLTDPMFGFTK